MSMRNHFGHSAVRALRLLAGTVAIPIMFFVLSSSGRLRYYQYSSMVFRLLRPLGVLYSLKLGLLRVVGIQFPLDHFVGPFPILCVCVHMCVCTSVHVYM